MERQPLQALPCLMLAGTATSNERWGAEEKGHRGVRETNGGMKYWPRQNRRKETDRERGSYALEILYLHSHASKSPSYFNF